MNQINHIKIIDKNEVANLIWPKESLHNNEDEKMDLLIKLKVALILGNMERIKCRIVFMDSIGIKVIETTIWAVCEKNILIKAGLWVPIRRVVDVII